MKHHEHYARVAAVNAAVELAGSSAGGNIFNAESLVSAAKTIFEFIGVPEEDDDGLGGDPLNQRGIAADVSN